jgi:hypothetical protein
MGVWTGESESFRCEKERCSYGSDHFVFHVEVRGVVVVMMRKEGKRWVG